MATTAQVLANRANSQRSTGPQTEAGKERSSRNSFQHGLTRSKVVLPGEDPAEYDAFRADILQQYQPANATEQILAEELSAAGWRFNRARAVETEVLKKLMGDAADSAVGLATVFIEKPKEFQRLLRDLTSIERAYYRALNLLIKLQKERRAEQQAPALEQNWLAEVRQQAELEQQAASNPPVVRQTMVQQATESKKRPNKSASFRKYANVPRLSCFQLLNAYRKANRNAAA